VLLFRNCSLLALFMVCVSCSERALDSIPKIFCGSWEVGEMLLIDHVTGEEKTAKAGGSLGIAESSVSLYGAISNIENVRVEGARTIITFVDPDDSILIIHGTPENKQNFLEMEFHWGSKEIRFTVKGQLPWPVSDN